MKTLENIISLVIEACLVRVCLVRNYNKQNLNNKTVVYRFTLNKKQVFKSLKTAKHTSLIYSFSAGTASA